MISERGRSETDPLGRVILESCLGNLEPRSRSQKVLSNARCVIGASFACKLSQRKKTVLPPIQKCPHLVRKLASSEAPELPEVSLEAFASDLQRIFQGYFLCLLLVSGRPQFGFGSVTVRALNGSSGSGSVLMVPLGKGLLGASVEFKLLTERHGSHSGVGF